MMQAITPAIDREGFYMTTEFSNRDDVIDTRDIVARIEELQAEVDNIDDMPEGDMLKHTVEGEEMRQELAKLQKLVEEINGYAGDDCEDGVTLIRDDHFEDYARELAEEIGAIEKKVSWPYTCIDWEQAASKLQTDYTSVEYDGVTYWFR